MAKNAITAKPKPPDGSAHRPFPWTDPFPESKPKDVKRGTKIVQEETVFVRAVPIQDIIINGIGLKAGVAVTVGADFAHAHAGALKAE